MVGELDLQPGTTAPLQRSLTHATLPITAAGECNLPLDESSTTATSVDESDLVPTKYHNLIGVFSKAGAETLHEHSERNIKLDLIKGSVLHQEDGCLAIPATIHLCEQIDDMLAKGFICESCHAATVYIIEVPASKKLGP